MPENLFETQYDLTKKSKLRVFYESNKILLYSFILVVITVVVAFSYYQHSKEKKKIFLSDKYIQAKVYLEKGDKIAAVEILKDVIFSNDPTYSALSLFMILNENLINNNKEISKLFNYLLENNKFDREIRNLLLYKKILYESNYIEDWLKKPSFKKMGFINAKISDWIMFKDIMLGRLKIW